MSTDQMQQAYQLIRNGRSEEAIAILVPIVRATPTNADAWWLLANAVDNPDQKRRALQQVLRLRPDDERAQRMLSRLDPTSEPPPPAPPKPAAAQPIDSDPFADDPFSSAPASGSSMADPFADDPFEPAPARAAAADPFDDDPFAPAPPSRGKRRADDPFADDPFADAGLRPPPPPAARKGTSPLLVCLAIVGIIAVISCAALALVTAGVINLGGEIVSSFNATLAADPEFGNMAGTLGANPDIGSVFGTLAADPEFANMAGILGANPDIGSVFGTLAADPNIEAFATLGSGFAGAPLGSPLPADANNRGTIEYGQQVTGNLPAGSAGDAWTLRGSPGDRIIINMIAVGDTDPLIRLYDSKGELIAEDDDSGGNLNARLEFMLPGDGTVTILARTFFTGAGGAYELMVDRR
ncbi:MAG: tetratricopeptide repeat protein [Aggregatilineales bacterium]